MVSQVTQVRKNAYVAEAGEEYHPDRHRSCTIYAGTLVQQVCNSHTSIPSSSFRCCSFPGCSFSPSVRLFVCLSVCLSVYLAAVPLHLCLPFAMEFMVHLHVPLCSCTSLSDVSLVEPVPACQSVCVSVCLSLHGRHLKYSSCTTWMQPAAVYGC